MSNIKELNPSKAALVKGYLLAMESFSPCVFYEEHSSNFQVLFEFEWMGNYLSEGKVVEAEKNYIIHSRDVGKESLGLELVNCNWLEYVMTLCGNWFYLHNRGIDWQEENGKRVELEELRNLFQDLFDDNVAVYNYRLPDKHQRLALEDNIIISSKSAGDYHLSFGWDT